MINTIAITGASGFVGRHLVEFFKDSKKVICVTRRPANFNFTNKNVEVRKIDWSDKQSIKNAIKGADVVIHGAAIHPLRSVKNSEEIINFNVNGTRRLLECLDDVSKFVFISSMRALVNKDKKNARLNESSKYNFQKYDTAYGFSKYLSEQICLKFKEKNNLPLIIANPASVIGENDTAPSPNGIFIRSFIKSKIIFSVKATYSFVDVKDVARGIGFLIGRGAEGSYILCSANWPMEKFIKEIHNIANIKKPVIFLPLPLAFVVAVGFEVLERLVPKIKPPLIRSSVYYAKLNPSYDGSKICRDGFKYRNPMLTLKETVNWLKNKYS